MTPLTRAELVSIDGFQHLIEHGQCAMTVTADDVALRYACWRPEKRPGQPAAGTVTLLQGRTEFIEKYYETIEELLRRNFNVVAFDWRGQGGSARLHPNPVFGHVQDFSEYGLDLDMILSNIVLPDFNPPHYCLAHSMGGCILLDQVAKLGTRFDLAVLSAPMIHINMRLPAYLARALLALLTAIGLGRRTLSLFNTKPALSPEDNPFTHDSQRFSDAAAILQAAPELRIESPTIGWMLAAMRAMSRLQLPYFGHNITLPVLIIGAGRDAIVRNRSSSGLAARNAFANYVEIPGAFHELLIERDTYRRQFWAAFDAFIPGSGKME